MLITPLRAHALDLKPSENLASMFQDILLGGASLSKSDPIGIDDFILSVAPRCQRKWKGFELLQEQQSNYLETPQHGCMPLQTISPACLRNRFPEILCSLPEV